ncbi:MAG: transcriptional repressor [Sedimentisphaerales bacterium]|nr:transcriptional repressor [Sedimentisphaerales bacterium]
MSMLGAMLEAKEPLSREQIARRMGENANKVTLYRTLHSLVEAGIVHTALIRNRVQLYEPSAHCSEHLCHPHFVCRGCHKTICLTEITPPTVDLPDGFRLERQQLQMEGLCSTCTMAEHETQSI